MVDTGVVPHRDAKQRVHERVGGLQTLGSRALLLTLVIAECVALLALVVPADTTTASVRVLIVWNILLLCALAAWRHVGERTRRCFLYVVMFVVLLRWLTAWWETDLMDSYIGVLATLTQVPGILLAVSMMHRPRVGLGIGASWVALLGAIALAGSRRLEFAEDPLRDWRLGPLMVAMDVGLLVIVGWWAREREEFVAASRDQIDLIDAAHLDPLTGLANRRSTRQHLDELSRLPSVSMVALLDIDHFKSINDTFGHEGGDAVLRRVAAALEEAVRPADVVGRWGGEEFVVVAEGLNATLGSELVERLRSVVTSANVTASVGWTLWDPTSESWSEALNRADVALYDAKESGRDRSVAA